MAVTPDDWTPTVWSHAAVMDMQARLDPVRMTMYADDWQACVDTLRDVLADLNRQMSAQLDTAWRGLGADGAVAALQRYVSGSLDGLVACRSVAVHLYELSRAAGDLRACITPPADGETAGQRLSEALAQVRQLYSGPAVAAGDAVVDIPSPPEPFEIDGPTAGGLPSTPAAATVSPAGATAPAAGSPLDTGPMPVISSPAMASPIAPLSNAGPNPLWDNPTQSATLSPSAQTEPPSTTPGPVAATAPGQPPGAARSASPTATPYLGAAYPGLYGRGDGAAHRAPRYLISAWNTNELIGEAPLVAPAVIGE